MIDAAPALDADAPFVCTSGAVDKSFGVEGIVRMFGLEQDRAAVATGVAIDPQSRIVVAGGYISGARSCVLARLLPDGARDPGFGANGVVRASFDSHACWYNAVALQSDGKIVAFGEIDGHSQPRAILARHLADGRLDPSFGDAGIVVFDPAPITSGLAVAITPAGNVVVAGQEVVGETVSFFTRQRMSDGSPDTTFGIEGTAESAFTSGRDMAADLVVQSDGKIIVVGTTGSESASTFGIVRYRANGTRDPSFGDMGLATIAFDGPAGGTGIALDTSGRSLVVGISTTQSQQRGALSRLLDTGAPDAAFAAGVVGDASQGSFTSVAVDGEGGVLAIGSSDANLGSLALRRYTEAGAPDLSFGANGSAESLPLSMWRHLGWDLAVQDGGGIVVVGGYGDLSSFDMLVARYCP